MSRTQCCILCSLSSSADHNAAWMPKPSSLHSRNASFRSSYSCDMQSVHLGTSRSSPLIVAVSPRSPPSVCLRRGALEHDQNRTAQSCFFRFVLPQARLELRHQRGANTKMHVDWLATASVCSFVSDMTCACCQTVVTRASSLLWIRAPTAGSMPRSEALVFSADSVRSMERTSRDRFIWFALGAQMMDS